MSLGWLLWSWSLAHAQEDDGDDIDISNGTPKPAPGDDWTKARSQGLGDVDDDAGMKDFAAEERKKPPPPVRWHVDPTGKAPLADVFDLQVVAYTDAFVLAELPVLVALDRASFRSEHPGGFLLVAEVTSGATKRVVTEQVTPEAVYESAPTLVFLKAAVPNPAATDSVRFLVRTQELPPPPAVPDPGKARPPAAPPPPAPPKDRFARTTVFARPR